MAHDDLGVLHRLIPFLIIITLTSQLLMQSFDISHHFHLIGVFVVTFCRGEILIVADNFSQELFTCWKSSKIRCVPLLEMAMINLINALVSLMSILISRHPLSNICQST